MFKIIVETVSKYQSAAKAGYHRKVTEFNNLNKFDTKPQYNDCVRLNKYLEIRHMYNLQNCNNQRNSLLD